MIQKKIEEAKEEGEELEESEVKVEIPVVEKHMMVSSHQGFIYVENLEYPQNFPSG